MYMKNKSKKSLQKLILDFISKKKVIRKKELGEEIEIFIENSNNDYSGDTKTKYAINRVIKKMISDNILKEYKTDFSSFLSITRTGRHKLRQIKLSSQEHLIPIEWDGFWRIIVINIPESRKSERDALRYLLKKAQFVQLKNSLWISPFPMEHMFKEIKKDLGLHDEIMIFVTDTIDGDTEKILQEKFIEKES